MVKSEFVKKTNAEIHQMSLDDRVKYFVDYEEYVLGLPFDEKQMQKGQNRYLKVSRIIANYMQKKLQPIYITRKYDRLPNQFILVTNHLDSKDQFMHIAAFPNIPFHYMIAQSLLTRKNHYRGHLYTKLGGFPIDKDNPDDRRLAEEKALQYVFRGGNLTIFPEATRTLKYGGDGTVWGFKKGAASIAQASRIPILPGAINNDYRQGGLFMTIGSPFPVSYDDNVFDKTEELQTIVSELKEENDRKGAKIILRS